MVRKGNARQSCFRWKEPNASQKVGGINVEVFQ